MKKIITYVFLLFSLVSAFNAEAQIEVNNEFIAKTIEPFSIKNKDVAIKAKQVKGKVCGPGVCILKNGDLYIGDLSDKKFQGTGMYIKNSANNNEKIKEPGVYVGKFKDGLKNGTGTLYGKDGDNLYKGNFIDDSPINELSGDIMESRYFGTLISTDSFYIGELNCGVPDGLGAIFFNNGDFVVSKFKMGSQNGLSTVIYNDGNWTTNKIEGENQVEVSSSFEYAKFISERKETVEKSRKLINEKTQERKRETWINFMKALKSFGEILVDISEVITDCQNDSNFDCGVTNNNSNSSYPSGEFHLPGRENSKSKISNTPKYSLSEQQNYNVDKSVYSNYHNMLSQVRYGNRSATASEIKEWKSKMRALRKKWEDKGKSFPRSEFE